MRKLMRNGVATAALVALSPLASPAADAPWTSLFDGKTLAGWVQRGGKAVYVVADGCIVGKTVLKEPNSFLCTVKDYSDFIVEFEFKVTPELNSGVQFRSESFDTEKLLKVGEREIKVAAGRVHGYQYEIDNSPTQARWWTAGVYDEACRGWLFPGTAGGEKEAFTRQGAEITKAPEWNKARIEAVGDSIKTYLNGELRADFKDSRTPSGLIALQVHQARQADLEVRWRAIRIQALKPPTDTRAQ